MWVWDALQSKEQNQRHMMKNKHGCLALKRTVSYLTILIWPIPIATQILNQFLGCAQDSAILPIHVVGMELILSHHR